MRKSPTQLFCQNRCEIFFKFCGLPIFKISTLSILPLVQKNSQIAQMGYYTVICLTDNIFEVFWTLMIMNALRLSSLYAEEKLVKLDVFPIANVDWVRKYTIANFPLAAQCGSKT